MEQQGYVSLWAGKFKTDNDLQNYLKIIYSEDGDAIPSKFELDYNINDYDEDFMEVDYFDAELTNLPILLKGCSYDEIVIANYVEAYGETLKDYVNSIILLYNFNYNENANNQLSHVKYIGSVKYE